MLTVKLIGKYLVCILKILIAFVRKVINLYRADCYFRKIRLSVLVRNILDVVPVLCVDFVPCKFFGIIELVCRYSIFVHNPV